MTPLQKWAIGERDRIIKHPVEPGYLEVLVGHTENRRVFHYGVEVNSLHYNNQYLQLLSRRHGEKLHVDLKYYEDSLEFIHVFDPDEKVYFKVRAINSEYAEGLRLVQHQAIRLAIREQLKDPDSRELLLQKKQELQDIVTQSIHNKKMAKRKRGAVYQGRDNVAAKSIDANLYDELIEEDVHEAESKLPTFNVDWREDIKNQQKGDDHDLS
jgi:putative transposase